MKVSHLHQLALTIGGILVCISAVWSLLSISFSWSSFSGARGSLTGILGCIYQFTFGFLLIGASALGIKKPIEWFGVLHSYVGSGLVLIFLSVLNSGSNQTYADIATVYLFTIGLFSIVYGTCIKPKDTTDYPPLLK